jgi:exonuclease III
MKNIKHYLIHWNIKGNNREIGGNKEDTFKKVIDKAHHHNLSIVYCVNEINNDYVRHLQPNVLLQGLDKEVSGGIKKSNIFVSLKGLNNPLIANSKVNYYFSQKNPFRYRVVIAIIKLENKTIKILTFHSPVGSHENGNKSGSKVKAKFYAIILQIIKRENPDIITMDANEPKEYRHKFSNWEFHHNFYGNENIIEAQAAFKFIDKRYKRVKSGPTYNAFHYDHIFFNKNTVNLVKTKKLNKLTNLHKSDHKPIIAQLNI